jgi:uncharacterized protein (DUF1330 family)
MAYETVVGLNVNNDEIYDQYRLSISPLLKKYEGGFRYDFKINETLIAEESKEINRLFLIFFKNKDLMNSFFSESEYLKIKEEFFTNSVSSIAIISEYERS